MDKPTLYRNQIGAYCLYSSITYTQLPILCLFGKEVIPMASKQDRSEYFKQYCKEHAKERAETSRKWRKNNPEKERQLNKRQYRKRKREGKE